MKIEGKNACLETLKSSQTVNKIFVAKNLDKNTFDLVMNLARSKNCRVNQVDKTILDKMGEGRHQGIIIETTDFVYENKDNLMEFCANNENIFLLALDGIEDPHNLGSIIRTAECAGVDGVIIPKYRSCEVNETVIRTSAGAVNHIKIYRVGNLNDTIREIKQKNIFCFCLEAGGKYIYQTNLKGNICLVVGSEGFGVSRLTKELCDETLCLPLKGKVNSLNASNASAIAVYEALRQRR